MVSLELLEQEAIDAAINAEWELAIEKNSHIVKVDTHNIDAHLRLGYAFLQISNLKDARREYKKALRIQPKNNLALEHLEKIGILESKKKSKSFNSMKYDPDLFLEIPGRTRTIQLVNPGKKEDLAGRCIGEEVVLKPKKRRLEARTIENEYIGTLPDDISKRLLYFIKEGSKYHTYIKEIDLTDVIVFIKEVSKGKKIKNFPSFPSNPHMFLTDINQLDAEEKETTDDTEGEDDEENIGVDVQWEEEGELEDEDKEDLNHLVEVEDEEEEEE